MTDRIPLDELTSDQLDQLYDDRDRLGYEVQQWKSTYGEHALRDTLARLNGAEAAVARARTLRDAWLRMTLEPGQVRRLLDGLTAALAEPAPPPIAQYPDVLRERAETDMRALAEAEAVRQLDADPHGLKAGRLVQAYREYGVEKWVFRCWGTDDGCDGLLSLDHTSRQGAERARDRHVAEEHTGQRDG